MRVKCRDILTRCFSEDRDLGGGRSGGVNVAIRSNFQCLTTAKTFYSSIERRSSLGKSGGPR